MKPLMLGVLVAGLAVAGSAAAQRYDSRDDGRSERYEDNYDYARVVRVDPIIVADDRDLSRERCYQRPSERSYDGREGYYREGGDSDSGNRGLATVLGGVAGAVLGSRVGGGSGQLVGTALGTMVGGVAGRSIYDANHRDYQGDVRVCEPVAYQQERERVQGYDVTYEYAGRTYRTRRDYNPGDRIRVRVDVVAE